MKNIIFVLLLLLFITPVFAVPVGSFMDPGGILKTEEGNLAVVIALLIIVIMFFNYLLYKYRKDEDDQQ